MGIARYAARDLARSYARQQGRQRQAPRAPRPKGMMSAGRAMTPEGRAEFRASFGLPPAGAAVAVPESVTVAQRTAGQVAPAGLRREIDGAKLLDDERKYWRRYAWFDSDSKLTAVSLWTVAEHMRNASGALIFPEFAHLGFFSSEPGSGKTRCLQILQMLCANAPNIPIEPSEPAVALMLGREHRTVLLDEGDILFGAGKRKSAIRAILNSSYKKGGTWPRVRNNTLDDVKVDGGACAVAALDVMEKGTGSTLEALLQRFIKIRMTKPPAGTVIRKPREIVGEYQGRRITGEDIAARLKELATTWASQELETIRALTPQMPPGVELRQEELWTALLAVAQAADASAARISGEEQDGPGRWTQLAWEACTDMSLYGGTPDVIGENLDMLADLTAGWD